MVTCKLWMDATIYSWWLPPDDIGDCVGAVMTIFLAILVTPLSIILDILISPIELIIFIVYLFNKDNFD